MSNLQVWATIDGSHLAREPTASPVLTKWRNWELTLATNFGSHAQMVAKSWLPNLVLYQTARELYYLIFPSFHNFTFNFHILNQKMSFDYFYQFSHFCMYGIDCQQVNLMVTISFICFCILHNVVIPPASTKLKEGYTGFTLSFCPVCPSMDGMVRSVSSTILAGSISYLFIHIIKQLRKVCHVYYFFQNSKIWIISKFYKFVNLTLSCFDLGSDINK